MNPIETIREATALLPANELLVIFAGILAERSLEFYNQPNRHQSAEMLQKVATTLADLGGALPMVD